MLYVSIPISPSTKDPDISKKQLELNLDRGVRISNFLIDYKIPHYNPIFSILMHEKKPRSHEEYLEYDYKILDFCTGLLVTGFSKGVLKEILYCIQNNKPVYYGIPYNNKLIVFDIKGYPYTVKDKNEAIEHYHKLRDFYENKEMFGVFY